MKHNAYPLMTRFSKITAVVALLCTSLLGFASNLDGQTYSSSHLSISVMISDDHVVWVGTHGQGLLRFKKEGGSADLFTTSNSGLTDDNIQGLTFDSSGAILIGTSMSGIVRFNGSTWERLPSLSGLNVTGVCVDKAGIIWASTGSGVFRLVNGSWVTVINRITGTITTDKNGNVWVYNRLPIAECSSGFIYEYVNGGLNTTLSLGSICPETMWPYYFAIDGKRNAWLGGGQRLLKINENKVDSFVTHPDTQPEQISALAVNYNEVIMIALRNAAGSTEIHLYNQISGKGKPFDSATITLPGFYIAATCTDRDGSFFCAGLDGTIIKINPSGDTTYVNRGTSLLPSNTITSLILDKAGALWAGTGGGIAQYFQNAWTVYPRAGAGDTLPGPSVASLALDSSGIIWAGFTQSPIMSSSQSGMAQFSGKHWSTALYDHIPVAMISVDKEGTIWTIRDGDGVYRYKNGTAEQLFKTVPSSDREISMGTNVRSLTFDKENIPWIGTGLGIKKYINGAWVNDSTVIKFLSTKNSDSKLPGVLVNMLSFDRSGTLWAGTVKGLVQCSSGGCTLYDTTGSVLPDNTVQCIAFDTNNVWVGTKGGLVKLGSDPSNHLTYTAANSALRDNDITAIAFTKNGDLWTGTRLGGLTRFLASSIASSPSVSVVTKHHSLSSEDISYSFLSNSSCNITINTGNPAVSTFTLLSLNGKTIRSYNCTHSGKISFVWNGLDKYNRHVPGGLYLGVLKERGKIVTSRILPMP